MYYLDESYLRTYPKLTSAPTTYYMENPICSSFRQRCTYKVRLAIKLLDEAILQA